MTWDYRTTFKNGERVFHRYLGRGKVVKEVESTVHIGGSKMYLVKFDRTPSIRYNKGENPCLLFAVSLKRSS